MGRSRSRSGGRYRSRSRSRGRRHRDTRDRHRSPERRRRRSSVEEVKESPKKPEDSNKPKVTESNGEISMSIEETNKLRISMGLKPLRLTKPESKEVNLAKSREDVENENQQKQLKEALEKSKKKRAYAAKLQGKSLGEMLQEDASSTLDWVRRNRAMQPKAAVEAKKKDSQGDATYSSSDLKGLTVAHDAQSFEEGEEVILTLKDNQILTADLGDVNQEDDELENVNLAEADKRKEREEQAKRASGPVYTGYDDDEFTAHFSEERPKKRLLTQYDEEDDMQEARARKKFALSELGSHAVEKPVVREVAPGTISLGSIKEFQTMDDYYTKEEMAVFNKKKAKKLRKKKGGKARQREADEDTENLVQQLEAEATSASNDHGKRQRDGANAVAQLEAQNRAKFENARKKESEKARAALATTQDDIDEELSASLARSRQLALQAVAKNPIEVNDAGVLSFVTSEGGNIHRDETTENTFIVSETTDFDVRVKNVMEERTSRSTEEPQRAPEKVTIAEDDDEEETKEDAPEEDEEKDAGTWGVEEPLVQSGMAATLALLRNRGDLREELQLRQAGRANDHRDRNINDELQIKDGVKLDYRDEFGRLLTKKEAFRQLSYRFHGHQPGKKKQEKRLKQLKEELSQKKSSVSIKMQSLDRRQKQTKQAHLVLSEGT